MSKTIYILYYSGSGNTKIIAEKINETFLKCIDDSVELILKNAKEFIAGTLQRFHNYNKNKSSDGGQIIDDGDLQIFSDNWRRVSHP